jgi:hypothetical protein
VCLWVAADTEEGHLFTGDGVSPGIHQMEGGITEEATFCRLGHYLDGGVVEGGVGDGVDVEIRAGALRETMR